MEANDPHAARITKLIIETIALDDLPFNFVTNEEFRPLLHYVEPRYQIPDEKHFRRRSNRSQQHDCYTEAY